MTQLRFWICAAVFWLFLFFNVERIHEPINIASFVYVYAAASGILILSLQGTRKGSRLWTYGPILGLFVALKTFLGYPLAGQALPLTITEVFGIAVTVALTRQVSWSVARFERGASEMMTMNLGQRASNFEDGQAEIYREVRRARKFGRPLALVTLAPTSRSMSSSINRYIENVQRETVTRYVNGLISELLSEETHDCDIITQCGDYFLLLLPETTADRAEQVTDRIRVEAQEKLGLNLRAGTVTFPNEEITFTGLLEKAEGQLREQLEREDGSPPRFKIMRHRSGKPKRVADAGA